MRHHRCGVFTENSAHGMNVHHPATVLPERETGVYVCVRISPTCTFRYLRPATSSSTSRRRGSPPEPPGAPQTSRRFHGSPFFCKLTCGFVLRQARVSPRSATGAVVNAPPEPGGAHLLPRLNSRADVRVENLGRCVTTGILKVANCSLGSSVDANTSTTKIKTVASH